MPCCAKGQPDRNRQEKGFLFFFTVLPPPGHTECMLNAQQMCSLAVFSHINFSFQCPHPETAFPSIHPAISATYFPLKKRIIVSGLTTAHKIHWNLRSKNVLLHLNLKTPAVQSQVCNSKPTAKKRKCQGPDTFLNIPDFALGKQWEYCLFCFFSF